MSVRTSATPSAVSSEDASTRLVDPRGLCFVAAITTVVLALVLVTGNGWLLAA